MRSQPLVPCSRCRRHAFADEPACPFCGAPVRSPEPGRRAMRAGAVAAALVVGACGGVTEGAAADGGQDGARGSSADASHLAPTPDGAGSDSATPDNASPPMADATARDARSEAKSDVATISPAPTVDAGEDDSPCDTAGCVRHNGACICAVYRSPPPAPVA